jgi:ribokinase
MGRGSKLPAPGATTRGDTFYSGAGGKGANQAVAAARLGARVALVGKVGGDERGRDLVEHLRREGVNTDQIGTAAQQSSGAAIVQIDNRGEKQILMVQGANARLAPADVHAAKALLSGAKVVVTQLEVSMEVVATTISLGHALGARVVLDPAPPARLSDDLFPLLSMIRPNADEAEALTGVHVHDRASAKP